MVQVADDAARHMKRPWLGPAGSWRWPFDATFTQWGVGAALAVAAVVPLKAFVPVALLALAAGRAFSGWLAPLLAPEKARPVRWGLDAALGLLAALLVPSWRFWVLPLPGLLAIPAAVAVAVLIVRRAGGVIDWNRTVAYWLAMPLRQASGPRVGERIEIDVKDLEG
jgi:hypothetical protein